METRGGEGNCCPPPTELEADRAGGAASNKLMSVRQFFEQLVDLYLLINVRNRRILKLYFKALSFLVKLCYSRVAYVRPSCVDKLKGRKDDIASLPLVGFLTPSAAENLDRP